MLRISTTFLVVVACFIGSPNVGLSQDASDWPDIKATRMAFYEEFSLPSLRDISSSLSDASQITRIVYRPGWGSGYFITETRTAPPSIVPVRMQLGIQLQREPSIVILKNEKDAQVLEPLSRSLRLLDEQLIAGSSSKSELGDDEDAVLLERFSPGRKEFRIVPVSKLKADQKKALESLRATLSAICERFEED